MKTTRGKLSLATLAVNSAFITLSTPVSAAEDKAVERIEVTGSRIKRTEIESAQPVLTVTREDIDKSGLTSVSDVLRDISAVSSVISHQINNGNVGGIATVNMRNCGSARNLVLLNGRRWVSRLAGNVDLSTIPMAAVQRIDVLKDGASSIYGTDAICGVVNIITRNDFDGAQASVYRGQFDEADGERETYALTIGSQGEKSSSLISVSHTKNGEVMAGDRELSAVPVYGLPAQTIVGSLGASPTTGYGQFPVALNPATPTVRTNVTLDPSRPGCEPGVKCQPATASDFRRFNNATDGYNFAPENYLYQPSETTSLFAQGSYALTENIQAKTEVLFNERLSTAQLAASPLSGANMPVISANNYYNPFGQDVRGSAFRPIAAPRSYSNDVDTWRWSASLTGDFELAGRNFSWDVGGMYSDNESILLKSGFFSKVPLTRALGPSRLNGNGQLECFKPGTAGAAEEVYSGCVPMNFMGGPDGITPEMLKYVTVNPRDLAYSRMNSYSANLTGDIVDLPAGPLAFAVGVETRRESGFTQQDPLTVAGEVVGDTAATPTRGGFDLKEAYLETSIPLLADLPGVESLELTLATRQSEYSNFGKTTNSRFALSYRPFGDLLLRAGVTEGFRAPSINDLYLGNVDGFPSPIDPCSSDSVKYQNSAEVRARCAAAGVPTSFVQRPQTQTVSGGNPNTQPERSTNKTLGFVYSPNFIEGLDLTLDWYNISIENAIGTRGATAILDDCYVRGIASRCALVTRDMTGEVFNSVGQVTRIVNTTTNFKDGLEVEGFDFNLGYRFETGFGDMQFRWDNAYVDYYGGVDQPFVGELDLDGDISTGNGVGKLSTETFRLKSNMSLSWSLDEWSASISAEYQSKMRYTCSKMVTAAATLNRPELKERCSNPDARAPEYTFAPGSSTQVVSTMVDAPYDVLDPHWYFDVQGGWKTPWQGQLLAGIRNVADKDPQPAYNDTNSFNSNYRVPGRYYYMSYTHNF